jgi:hypothetical protein
MRDFAMIAAERAAEDFLKTAGFIDTMRAAGNAAKWGYKGPVMAAKGVAHGAEKVIGLPGEALRGISPGYKVKSDAARKAGAEAVAARKKALGSWDRAMKPIQSEGSVHVAKKYDAFGREIKKDRLQHNLLLRREKLDRIIQHGVGGQGRPLSSSGLKTVKAERAKVDSVLKRNPQLKEVLEYDLKFGLPSFLKKGVPERIRRGAATRAELAYVDDAIKSSVRKGGGDGMVGRPGGMVLKINNPNKEKVREAMEKFQGNIAQGLQAKYGPNARVRVTAVNKGQSLKKGHQGYSVQLDLPGKGRFSSSLRAKVIQDVAQGGGKKGGKGGQQLTKAFLIEPNVATKTQGPGFWTVSGNRLPRILGLKRAEGASPVRSRFGILGLRGNKLAKEEGTAFQRSLEEIIQRQGKAKSISRLGKNEFPTVQRNLRDIKSARSDIAANTKAVADAKSGAARKKAQDALNESTQALAEAKKAKLPGSSAAGIKGTDKYVKKTQQLGEAPATPLAKPKVVETPKTQTVVPEPKPQVAAQPQVAAAKPAAPVAQPPAQPQVAAQQQVASQPANVIPLKPNLGAQPQTPLTVAKPQESKVINWEEGKRRIREKAQQGRDYLRKPGVPLALTIGGAGGAAAAGVAANALSRPPVTPLQPLQQPVPQQPLQQQQPLWLQPMPLRPTGSISIAELGKVASPVTLGKAMSRMGTKAYSTWGDDPNSPLYANKLLGSSTLMKPPKTALTKPAPVPPPNLAAPV